MENLDVSKDEAPKHVNTRYLFGIFGNVFVCCMQAGFAIASNNEVGQIL
jgi:hypothetical protein